MLFGDFWRETKTFGFSTDYDRSRDIQTTLKPRRLLFDCENSENSKVAVPRLMQKSGFEPTPTDDYFSTLEYRCPVSSVGRAWDS